MSPPSTITSPRLIADAELDAPSVGDIGIAVGHRPLHFDGTAHRVDHAGEFASRPSPVVLTMRPRCSGDLRIDQFAQMRLEALVGPFLIRPHQPRIPRHIGGKDCGELPFDLLHGGEV